MQHIAETCVRNLAAGEDHIYLQVRGEATGERKRLLGRRGPLGEVLSCVYRDDIPLTNCLFKASEVLKFLVKEGLCEIDIDEEAVRAGFSTITVKIRTP